MAMKPFLRAAIALLVTTSGVWAQSFNTYVNGLPQASAIGPNDIFYIQQGASGQTPGVSRKVSASLISGGALLNSPNTWLALQTFSGGAAAPTLLCADSTTSVATTAFVQACGGGALLTTPNTWTMLQTFNAGINLATGSTLRINTLNGLSFPTTDTTLGASIAIGPAALLNQSASAAYGNVAIGDQAIGGALTSAAIQNTAVGFQAMATTTAGNANSAFGYQALLFNTTGPFNSAFGVGALGGNTTGGFNTAVGVDAMSGNTTGGFNTGIGFLCCNGAQTGSENVWIGHATAIANTSGSNNIGIGQSAMAANTTGTGNTAIGIQALAANTTNGPQLAIGNQAMQHFTGTSGTTDIRNTSVGNQTFQFMTVGGYNTAFGYEAGLFLGGSAGADCTGSCTGNTALGALANTYTTAGNFNTGVGYFALFGNNRADSPTFTANFAFNNTAVGANAGLAIENGGQNTLIGMNSGKAITGTTGPPATDGDDNTAIGFNSCDAVTTGIRNVCLGSGSNTNGTTGTGNITIGYGINVSAPTVSQELHVGYNGVDTITGNLSTKAVTVQGVINVPTTTTSTGQYQINNSVFMHNGGVASDTFVGNAAGNFTVSGANDTCIGSATCGQLTTGAQNTTTGQGNLGACTTCSFNTSMGYNALVTATTPQQNAAFGFTALVQDLTGANNSAFGAGACSDVTVVSSNTCIGVNEGAGQTSSGGNNTFVGNTTAAGVTQTTTLATFNSTTAVVLGGNDTNLSLVAGMRVTSGGCIPGGTTIASVSSTQNVTLSQAAICGTSGQITFTSSPYQTFNTTTTGVGCFTTTTGNAVVNLAGTGTCTVALMGLLKGQRVIGNTVNLTSGATISSINSNTQITMSIVAGTGVAAGNATFQNPLGGTGCLTCGNVVLIGRWLAGMFPNNLSGNLSGGIGFADGAGNNRGDYAITTAAAWTWAANTNITGTLAVSAIASNTGAQTGYLCYNTTGGVITYDTTNTCLVSSERYKENIVPFAPTSALDEAMRLIPSSFNRRAAYSPDTAPRLGLIAEQVADVDERLVVRGADGLPRGVLYETGGLAVAIGAIQALKADNDNLRSRLSVLEAMSR